MRYEHVKNLPSHKFKRLVGVRYQTFHSDGLGHANAYSTQAQIWQAFEAQSGRTGPGDLAILARISDVFPHRW